MGPSNPWLVCHTWPKEPFLTMLWTHFESFVCNAIGSEFDSFSSCMFVNVSSACMCNGSVPIRPKAVVFDSRALLCSAEATFGGLLAREGQIARTHGLRVSSCYRQ